jgi:hypothetical protein
MYQPFIALEFDEIMSGHQLLHGNVARFNLLFARDAVIIGNNEDEDHEEER